MGARETPMLKQELTAAAWKPVPALSLLQKNYTFEMS